MLYEAIPAFVYSGPGGPGGPGDLFHLIPTSSCNKINREYLFYTNILYFKFSINFAFVP